MFAGFGGKQLQPSDDYYGGMVAAAIIATIAILLCLFLAFLLVRRPAKPAEPSPPARKNGPSYENPAFKVGSGGGLDVTKMGAMATMKLCDDSAM